MKQRRRVSGPWEDELKPEGGCFSSLINDILEM